MNTALWHIHDCMRRFYHIKEKETRSHNQRTQKTLRIGKATAWTAEGFPDFDNFSKFPTPEIDFIGTFQTIACIINITSCYRKTFVFFDSFLQ